MQNIEIGIPCGPNSEKYANFLIKSIESTVNNIESIKVIIGINKENINKSIILESLNIKPIFVERYFKISGSEGHGDCLNLILENMSHGNIGVFADVDSAFITPKWDSILLDHINKNNISFIGSEYHKTDGKIVDLPNVITAMFKISVLKDSGVNFIPSLKKGGNVFLDTGCEAILKLKEKGHKLDTLKIVSPRYKDTADKFKFMLPNMRGEEYQLGEIPISTHIGRSLNRNFDKDPVICTWKKRVEEWLVNG